VTKNNLFDFRKQIDDIDSQIFALVKKRAQVVGQVKSLKNQIQPNTLFIKPDREAQMINSIIKKYIPEKNYSLETYIYLQRLLISASNFLEQDITIGFTDKNSLTDIHKFYTPLAKLKHFQTVENLLNDLKNNIIQIGVLPYQQQIPTEYTIFDNFPIQNPKFSLVKLSS
jgi:chorismate mutase